MNQDLNLLNKNNMELTRALGHFVESLPSSGPLASQVQSITQTLHANDATYTLASLIEQYTKMQQSINALEREDKERDLAAFKVLITQSANKNIPSKQRKKLTAILADINVEQPTHALMISAGKALVYLADELSQLTEISESTSANNSIELQTANVSTAAYTLASKRLIKTVVAVSKKLSKAYPEDNFISKLLYEVKHVIPGNEGAFHKSVDLLAQTANYLALLLEQERCWTEEVLNDIHSNLMAAFKQTAIIDKLIVSTKNNANQVKLAMVTELEKMEVNAKSINTITGMQKHINHSVLLMSEIINGYNKLQNETYKTNIKTINLLHEQMSNATSFIEKLEGQLNSAKESNLIDELTGVGNRKGYVQVINKERAHWLATKRPLTLILIDVDKFKDINDNFGHSIGDQVLKSLIETLKSTIRSTDYIARFGGDEFVIILPETDLDMTFALTKKIRKVLSSLKFKIRRNNKQLKISCSYGISGFTNKVSSTVDVFNAADKALYQAKENGRDVIIVYSEGEFISMDQ